MPGAIDSPAASTTAIAGHRVFEVLEQGASGGAYRATAPDGRNVILRVCAPTAGQAATGRLRAQAEALSELTHPSLPRVLGFGEAPEGTWMATAEVEGLPLRALVAQGLAPMRAVRLLGEVADGLDAAHRAGIVHGDVRPENILVQSRPTERARLVDFPLEPASPTGDRVRYAAPEVKAGGASGPAADVFAVAATLRECVLASGTEPPPALGPVLDRGLDPEPAHRHETAGELMAQAARSLLETGPKAPARVPPAAALPPAQPQSPRRGRLAGALAAVLAVIVAAGGGYALGRLSDSGDPPAPRSAAAGAMEIRVPAGWERSGARPGTPRLTGGLSLRGPGERAVIRAGIAADRGAVLDPSRLVTGAAARRSRSIRIGRVRTLRFTAPRRRGFSVLYVASPSAGAAAVACSGVGPASACDEAAAGLRVRGARAYDPVAGIAWKNRLAAQMGRLRSRRAAALRRLRRAGSPRAQAARASSLGRLYAATARRVRAGDAPPQAARTRRRVSARLGAAAVAYRGLARAARAEDAKAFGRARVRIRRAERGLRLTLRSL